MTFKKINRNAGVALFLMLCGCATAMQQLIDPPKVEYKHMRVSHGSFFDAVPIFTFEVANSNPMGITVENISYSLKINDQKFVKGVSGQNVRIKPADSGLAELPVAFTFMDVFESVPSFIAADSVRYELSGHVKAGPFSIPFETGGIFPVPKTPEIVLTEARVDKTSASRSDLYLHVEVRNPNEFEVAMEEIDCEIRLGETLLAEKTLRLSSPLRGNAAASVEISIPLDDKPGDALSEVAITGEMTLTAAGRGAIRFPFQSGTVLTPGESIK